MAGTFPPGRICITFLNNIVNLVILKLIAVQ